MKSLPLIDDFSFSSFVTSGDTSFAKEASIAFADPYGSRHFGILLIQGPAGSGKTHLMHAVGNALQSGRSRLKIACTNTDHFVSGVVQSLQNNTLANFRSEMGNLDVLLLDDVDMMAHKERSQEELTFIIDEMLSNRKKVIVTFDSGVLEREGWPAGRLFSRLQSGLRILLNHPDKEARLEILRQAAARRHLTLPHEVAAALATDTSVDVRQLLGNLTSMAEMARVDGIRISLDLLAKIVPKRKHATSDEIEHEIACAFCAAKKSESQRMIQGPGVAVCDRCICLMFEMLSEE